VVIRKILDQLKAKTEVKEFTSLPESCAPPLGLPAGISDWHPNRGLAPNVH
jgi:hypothetical protein